MDQDVSDLKSAVESTHGVRAAFLQTVPVKEEFQGQTVWEGTVSVFSIVGHSKANRAYAWSYPIEGTTRHRYYAVLHVPPVDSPEAAVRAAILSDTRSRF